MQVIDYKKSRFRIQDFKTGVDYVFSAIPEISGEGWNSFCEILKLNFQMFKIVEEERKSDGQ